MFRRHYTVRFDPSRTEWELFRGASDRKAADVVATYPTQDAAVAGCETICAQIVQAGMNAQLQIEAEDGTVIAERTFEPDPTTDRASQPPT